MSPHILDPDTMNDSPQCPGLLDRSHHNGSYWNGSSPGHSLLNRFDDEEVHDLICVGFGPASLAIAVALHDGLETGNPSFRNNTPKVRFIERQEKFRWHAGMLLPGTKMQITFIKDLATLRNPRSQFTFLNYLHRNNRLVPFTNLGTFLPQRIEYEDYMRWCAAHFDDVVDYGYNVETVDVGYTSPKTGAVEYFQIKARDRISGQCILRRAKNVVIAVGGEPYIPKSLKADHSRLIHSSQYATTISQVFPPGTAPKSVAVIGAGQSAAEVFHNIPTRFPGSKSYLLIKGSTLRPSDDSPFVNEIFDPDRVDDVYSQDSEVRAHGLALDRGTNYGVVRLELLEEIYSALYSYRIQYSEESDWPQQILAHRTVTGMDDVGSKDNQRIRLHIQNDSGNHHVHEDCSKETLDVDLVVVASGYKRDAHVDMLQGLEHLKPINGLVDSWKVNRDYSVDFKEGALTANTGIWLQGCNESTHGLSDTLLSILATRGGEMLRGGLANPENDPASEAVRSALFGTAELFEQILQQVDMKTLLLSQRVSKEWCKLIAGTPSLQKKLFFEPASLKEATSYLEIESHHSDLLMARTLKFGDTGKLQQQPWVVVRNPLILDEDAGQSILAGVVAELTAWMESQGRSLQAIWVSAAQTCDFMG